MADPTAPETPHELDLVLERTIATPGENAPRTSEDLVEAMMAAGQPA